MAIRIYDLAAAEDDRLFSPYCWRTKLALAHKGLAFESIPWRFTEKDALAAAGSRTVPVIIDGERTVSDSWTIALYLEDAYPGRPKLFEGPQARALAFGFKQWVERVIQLPMLRAVILDIHAGLHPKDKAYFRESREKRLGNTLEAVAADQDKSIAALRGALDPVRRRVIPLQRPRHPVPSTRPGFRRRDHAASGRRPSPRGPRATAAARDDSSR